MYVRSTPYHVPCSMYTRMSDAHETQIHHTLVLKLKLILRHATDPNINPENPAAVPNRLRQVVIVTVILGSSNKQLGTNKDWTGHVSRREIDLTDNLSGRGNAQYLSAAVDSAPDAALDINSKAIGL